MCVVVAQGVLPQAQNAGLASLRPRPTPQPPWSCHPRSLDVVSAASGGRRADHLHLHLYLPADGGHVPAVLGGRRGETAPLPANAEESRKGRRADSSFLQGHIICFLPLNEKIEIYFKETESISWYARNSL